MTSIMAVVGLLTTGVDAGLVGLVLSYALNITGSLVCPDIIGYSPYAYGSML